MNVQGSTERDPTKPQFSIGHPKPGTSGIINIQIHGTRFDGSDFNIVGFKEEDGEMYANFEVYRLCIDGFDRDRLDLNDADFGEFNDLASGIAEDLVEMGMQIVQQAKVDETGEPAEFDPSILESGGRND